MKNLKSFCLILLMLGLTVSTASALSLGHNITIYDKNGCGNGWYGDSEDNEVEPGMERGQKWDLEAFFFTSDHILSLSGGYNFKDGFKEITSGDIFIAVDGSPDYDVTHRTGGQGNKKHTGNYGYDYVFDLDFTDWTYTVYGLDESSILQTAFYQQNEGSSPWQYDFGDNDDDLSLSSGTFSFLSKNDSLPSEVTTFKGGNKNHYLLTGFDLSFLDHGTEFYAHFTMGCGNDNLMGKAIVTPEPGTWMLLGCGLVGLALWQRRRKA